MRLVESYLNEVGRYLPGSDDNDILRELRASLEEQVYDAAGDATPGPQHEKTVLNRLGHPMKVASGYRGQRYLIGPELFPIFIQTLKTVLVVVAVIQLALMLTGYVASGWTTSVKGLASGLFGTLLWATVVVLVVFAVTEYSGERLNWYDGWTADSLRPTRGASVKGSNLVTNLVSEGVFLLWWNDVLPFHDWIPGAIKTFDVALGSVWEPLFWPLNLLFGAWFVLHAWVLIRGLWQPATLYTELALGALGIAAGGWLLLHGPLLSVSGDVGADGELIAHRVMLTIIGGALVITAWDMLVAWRRLRRAAS